MADGNVENIDYLKIGLEILSFGATAIVGWIGLKLRETIGIIKLQNAKDKADVLDRLQEAKDTLASSTEEAKEAMRRATQTTETRVHAMDVLLSSHIVQDGERFSAMTEKWAALTLELSRNRTDVMNSMGVIAEKIDRNYAERLALTQRRPRE